MAIDLKRCAGCQTCTIACKIDNDTPPGVMWRNVRDVEVGTYPNVTRFFLPLQCMQCAKAPCLEVCPTTATQRRADGIIYIDYEKCVGCGYCVLACPFEARWLPGKDDSYFPSERTSYRGWIPNDGQKNLTGVCTKCDFCMDRIDAGLKSGLRVGTHPEATPVCVNSCPAKALTFGDLDDVESELVQTIRTRRSFRLRTELATDPSVYYVW